MKLRLLLPFFLLMIAAQWRQGATLAITSPAADEILRGPVAIAGTLDVSSFASAQLDFAYASHPTDTWFPLQTFSEPVIDATLAVWDT
ncbi:MAG TPA: hypothetical protein VK880_05950, partial [Anaerolineales bacterium]|nr:hypothetical protein [Anaerolineales bacterium]